LFERLQLPPEDPILSLGAMVQSDARPEKLNLGIGVYVDEHGQSPVMTAVRHAEQRVLDRQVSKAYLSPRGNAAFLGRLGNRVFSPTFWVNRLETIDAVQTVGCVAALRLGGEILGMLGARRIWISDPTWPIHAPIMSAAGLEPVPYPYYSVAGRGLRWAEMLAALQALEPGDALLLHGCCHNPTGEDLTLAQWRELAALCRHKQVLPFVDVAYAGLGRGWDDDLAGMRALIETVDEAIVAVSCSKSFGLYRERTGALFFSGRADDQVSAVVANAQRIARTSYSMPPDHGAAVVAEILGSPDLEAEWIDELQRMRRRIAQLRNTLVEAASRAGLDWAYLREQRGMFSLLALDPDEVTRLREEYAIYMPLNGRICIPGLSEQGCAHLAKSCADLRNVSCVV
jgi:aspartate/tyrosine/aromatic aminotransferase